MPWQAGPKSVHHKRVLKPSICSNSEVAHMLKLLENQLLVCAITPNTPMLSFKSKYQFCIPPLAIYQCRNIKVGRLPGSSTQHRDTLPQAEQGHRYETFHRRCSTFHFILFPLNAFSNPSVPWNKPPTYLAPPRPPLSIFAAPAACPRTCTRYCSKPCQSYLKRFEY